MLSRRIARPLLATTFIYEGADALRRPARHVEVARGPVERVQRAVGVRTRISDRDLTRAVRAHAALTTVAGLGLALGRAPRTCALLLAGLSLPLAVAHEPFTKKPGRRAERTEPFIRAVGGIGAALLAAVDREGKPSFGWRVQHARTDRPSA